MRELPKIFARFSDPLKTPRKLATYIMQFTHKSVFWIILFNWGGQSIFWSVGHIVELLHYFQRFTDSYRFARFLFFCFSFFSLVTCLFILWRESVCKIYSFSKSEFTVSRGESTVVIQASTRGKIGTKEDFQVSSFTWDHREPAKTGYSWWYYDIKPFRYHHKFPQNRPFQSCPSLSLEARLSAE